MNRIHLSFLRNRKPGRRLFITALLSLLVLIGTLALGQRAEAKEGVLQSITFPKSPGRHFYITNTNVNGSQAAAACAEGYHMASLWEIHQVSGLIYANTHPAAKLRADNGSGPTAGWWGWARTGYDSSVTNTAGRANCGNWTSATSGEYGTLVRLPDNWTASATVISPWEAQTWSCSGTAPVWCVGDFHAVYLPSVLR